MPTALEFPDGRFSGAASFTMLHHVPTAPMQDRLFAEVARVLQPGGVLVAGDSLPDPALEAHHAGDTYNPVDPEGLADRLKAAGFAKVEVDQPVRMGRVGMEVMTGGPDAPGRGYRPQSPLWRGHHSAGACAARTAAGRMWIR